MALLDIPSLLCLSRVNRRYYHLHSDEYIWTDVDLTTVPKLNVQLVKKVIRDKLHPALWRLTLCSNAAECQRKPKLRPSITSSALDDIFRKCQRIRCIRLHNFEVCITIFVQVLLMWSIYSNCQQVVLCGQLGLIYMLPHHTLVHKDCFFDWIGRPTNTFFDPRTENDPLRKGMHTVVESIWKTVTANEFREK